MLSVTKLADRGPLYIAERHYPLLAILREGNSACAEEAIAMHILEVAEQMLKDWPTG